METKVGLHGGSYRHNHEFIQGFEENPFARIECRNLPNKMCSGTCMDCAKEREAFKINKMVALNSRNKNGDPHFEDIYGTPAEVWNNWLATIQREKLKFWERRNEARALADKTAKVATIITLH